MIDPSDLPPGAGAVVTDEGTQVRVAFYLNGAVRHGADLDPDDAIALGSELVKRGRAARRRKYGR